MSGGWLPPQAPGGPQPPDPQRPPDPRVPVFVRAEGEEGTNGLAVAALVCAIASLALLVLSLGLSFALSLPLGGAGWICAAKARRDSPERHKGALVLAIAAVGLSALAAIVWIVLVSAGVSVEDLQQHLQEELDRQRRAGS